VGVRLINNNQGGSIRVLGTTPNAKGAVWLGFCLLDRYPGAIAAYSLRRLRIQYTGPVIRVRRSSDNAEMDIGFDFSNDGSTLNESALLNFVGNANGFVTRWYDQSGNGMDQARTIASQQPQIVTNGTIYTSNGKPAIYFNGNMNMRSVINTSLTSPAGEWSSFGVIHSIAFNIAGVFFSYHGIGAFGDIPAIPIGQFLRTNTDLTFDCVGFRLETPRAIADKGPIVNANQIIVNSIRRTTTIEAFVNGIGNGSTSIAGTARTGITPLDVGYRNGNDTFQPIGFMQELIHYPLDSTSFYQNMVRQINAYYKTF
jgi:hypothetical protein